MVKLQTVKQVNSPYASNLLDGAGLATFLPELTTLPTGSSSTSSTFPASSVLLSSVSVPVAFSLPDSDRKVERRQSILKDNRIRPQSINPTNTVGNNIGKFIRTNHLIIDNNRCNENRIRRLFLRDLRTGQSINERDAINLSTLGASATRFECSNDMSLYRRNPKSQATRKTLETRISERKKKSKLQKSRKRLAKLLHTHAALIMLSVLVVLDATCVIGQLLADIFIVKENLENTEIEKQDLGRTLHSIFPKFFNDSDHLSLDEMLYQLKDTLEVEDILTNSTQGTDQHVGLGEPDPGQRTTATHPDSTGPQSVKHIANKPPSNATIAKPKSDNTSPNKTAILMNAGHDDILFAWKQLAKSLRRDEKMLKQIKESKNSYSGSAEGRKGNGSRSHSRQRSHSRESSRRSRSREKEDSEEEHDILLEVTHVFHLVSLSILSILLLETLLKIFAMGRKLWNHKLEVFDAAVIITSWSLDLAFKDGIWDHPGSNAATMLIILLPWRVVRIVNSFVLVIQEKDNVRLKLIKQRYRSSERRTREYKEKLNKYRVETKSLQGVCRKFGVPEGQITACMPVEKRKRSCLALTALSEFASLAMVSTVGTVPNLASKSEFSSDSSSSDDEESSDQHREIDRTVSADSAFSQTDSIFSTVSFAVECPENLGEDNIAYSHETLGNTSSLPTYEDAMISVYSPNSEEDQTQNQHTKL